MALAEAKTNSVLDISIPMQPASLDIWDKKYRLTDKLGTPVDQSIDDTFRRVARTLADVEQTPEKQTYWFGKFFWALQHGAIPAGRIISNAGANDYKPATSTINCTVSGTIKDSMDDILQKLHEAGMTLKCGCGIGYEFSTLRPRGAYVSGAGANTSGPVSFMDIYDRMCFTVSSAGGRRGAQMATFDIGHPDVLDFIRAKREHGHLRQFNLSLLLTDEFMQAVSDDKPWHLAFPLKQDEIQEQNIDLRDTSKVIWRTWPVHDGYVANDHGLVACKLFRTMPARRLWDMIMASTYEYAEPGIILIDRVNEMNNNWFCEDIRASNPCVTEETWVQTIAGPKQVRQLIGQPFTALVDGQSYASGDAGFFMTATKEVVKLQTVEGVSLRLTKDHRVRRVTRFAGEKTETEWCEAGKLEPGDRVLLHDHRSASGWPGKYTEAEGYLIGLLLGDGSLKSNMAVLSIWKPAKAVNDGNLSSYSGVDGVMIKAEKAARTLPHRSDFQGWLEIPGRQEFRLATAAIRDLANELGMRPGKKIITDDLEQASSEFCKGFLGGIFDADGSVQGTQEKGVSIRLSQSNLDSLLSIQRILLRLGIFSRIYRNRRGPQGKLLPDGKGGQKLYQTKAQHELTITGENIIRFKQLIGFADTDKQGRLERLLSNYQRALNKERFVARVGSITKDGIEAVYDVQIPGINVFDANGLHAHNCGEQVLPPYGACLLGSINLTRFVVNPFTEKAGFDWATFREVTRVFTRMLDNVVEINGLPIAEQDAEIRRKRRHGLGFMGLGSALTMMRMKYGDKDSLHFTEQVTRELALVGWQEALVLAKEKGPAPIMEEDFTITADMLRKRPQLTTDGYKEGDVVKGKLLFSRYSRYMQKIAELEPDLIDALAETGARFTHHSSIAPTGTISLSLANNASNGIEPSFAHHYSRNIIRENKKSKEKVDVWSYELLAYRSLVNPGAKPDSDKPEEKLPDYFTAADDVTPRQHIDIQAASQKWIDSSISKTANVPTDFPYADFKDIYAYAYLKGLKGCTTFRFNPEVFQGVLVKDKDLENTTYRFTLEDGQVIELKGQEEIEYDGETHTAANLYDALKEGYYGKY